MHNVPERVAACFRTVFPNLSDVQIATASANTLVEWDSLTSINLLTVMEEEFGVRVPHDEFGNLTSYQRIVDCFEGLVN